MSSDSLPYELCASQLCAAGTPSCSKSVSAGFVAGTSGKSTKSITPWTVPVARRKRSRSMRPMLPSSGRTQSRPTRSCAAAAARPHELRRERRREHDEGQQPDGSGRAARHGPSRPSVAWISPSPSGARLHATPCHAGVAAATRFRRCRVSRSDWCRTSREERRWLESIPMTHKTHLPALLDRVERGETITITGRLSAARDVPFCHDRSGRLGRCTNVGRVRTRPFRRWLRDGRLSGYESAGESGSPERVVREAAVPYGNVPSEDANERSARERRRSRHRRVPCRSGPTARPPGGRGASMDAIAAATGPVASARRHR